MASEYANARWRSLAVSLMSTGYGIGATLGGVLSLALIEHLGWRSIFLAGGVTTIAMLLISAWLLPESLDYLLAKRPKQALERINATVNRMGLNELPVMPRYEKSARKMAVSWANYLLDNLDFKHFVCGLHSF